MLPAGLLTSDDLDEIGAVALRSDNPLAVAAELAEAAELGRLADRADAGYAFGLAAEITAAEDLEAAEKLARRAAEAEHERGHDVSYQHAFHARLLLRLGREDEGMALMSALRPAMVTDPDAGQYVSESLAAAGYPEVAERWLTTAVEQALERRQALGPQRPQPDYSEAAITAYQLLQTRHHIRGDLGLPHDDHDHLADELASMVNELSDEERRAPLAVLYWPADEFAELLRRWPKLAGLYGDSWDEHRSGVEQMLTAESEFGRTRLALCTGSVGDLAGFAGRHGGDPTDEQVRQEYREHVVAHEPKLAWPPGRKDACWCGSGAKYKKCCRPRSRV